MRLYLAGPMRGYDRYNFPAFDRATRLLRAVGYTVVSPAEIDRAMGLDETQELPDWFDSEATLRTDFYAIKSCQGIALLPSWKKSTGAMREVAFARELDPHYRVQMVEEWIR